MCFTVPVLFADSILDGCYKVILHTINVFSCIFLTCDVIWFAAWVIDAVTEVGKTKEFTCWTVAATEEANVETESGAELLVTW